MFEKEKNRDGERRRKINKPFSLREFRTHRRGPPCLRLSTLLLKASPVLSQHTIGHTGTLLSQFILVFFLNVKSVLIYSVSQHNVDDFDRVSMNSPTGLKKRKKNHKNFCVFAPLFLIKIFRVSELRVFIECVKM